MGDYTFTDNELNELKDIFFAEAYELLQQLNQEALSLEAGHEKAERLRNIQRLLHTLKGNSRALGFTCINTLSHKAEDLLRTLQNSDKEVDQDLIDVLLKISDALERYLNGYKSGSDVMPDEQLVERVDNYLCTSEQGNGSLDVTEQQNASTGGLYDIVVVFDRACSMKPAGASLIIQKLSSAGEVLNVEPGVEPDVVERADRLTISFGSSEKPAFVKDMLTIPGIVDSVEIKRHDVEGVEPKSRDRGEAFAKDEAAQTLRVESLRVDKILNLVGELVIGRSVVGQVLSELESRHRKDDLVKRLGDANAFMEKTLSQLQKNVMKIRMLPISQVFRKFPRVVRDLALEKGKEVKLVMQGEKTELDKSILDVIGEPMIHLVRNAVDHGVEPPGERERSGKSRTGTVTLRASHEGNQIVIDIVDDGRGLDPERIKKKAFERGIKSQEELDRLSETEILDLIFLSGFSTAEVVTDISGRGFGMDIVKTTVESLKGRIHIHSKAGEGSVFTLRLPLTLAIIKAMLFRIGERLYALPLSSIEKIARIREHDIQTISGRNVMRFRDKVISLISLRESWLRNEHGNGQSQKKFVIVVGLADKHFGFLVDRLEGQQELVIKALDNHWGAVNCTSGASILGNGAVVLILDAPALIAREIHREAGRVQQA